jgi:DNA polymerase-3 subunit alpha
MYLNCHSYFSLRFGTFSEEKLLELAVENHVAQLALTDINCTAACMNFIRKAEKQDIKPIVGVDFRNGVDQQFVGIAKNNAGYKELNVFLSAHLYDEKPFGSRAPEFENAYIIYPFEKMLGLDFDDLKENEYIGISIKDLRKLPFSRFHTLAGKLIVLQPVTFRNRKDFNSHRLLRAIDNNTLLSMLPKSEEANEDEKMYPVPNLCAAFREFPHILENTDQLMKACHIAFSFTDPAETLEKPSLNLQTISGSLEEDEAEFERLCLKNLDKRYPNGREAALTRLYTELELIKKMHFVSYFLINYEIIKYAQQKKYFYVGRGSGANSIVAYLLEITDVDPIELDLYFERFINLFRTTPPDFDIDFSWRDREDITEFIFGRFGKTGNVALLGTYVTFNYRGVVRELGKVFGLPKEEIDRISDGDYRREELDETQQLILKYGGLINTMPNYLSVHSSGILISQESLHNYSATFLPPKGFPVVQFDMHIAEDVGLYKFDILAQRGLGKIKDTLEIIHYNKPGEIVDIHDLPRFKTDPGINALLAKGQCMGAFYIESPAMRMLLKKLEVNSYLGLVAASSIIRPGVSKSGMMREYLLRHRDPERAQREAHPVMLQIMPDTYGVMVYQEDVIKVAHYFAGLTLGEADVLRRGMSGKYRSRNEFKDVEQKFFANCLQKGYPEKTISEVWMQIESFAGYAFAKGHSASYAVESYQSLFLRAYYPLEFMVAVLNNGGGFYHTEIYVHEARMLGANIHVPCVNNSRHETVIIGLDIYLGFGYLSQLEERVIARIFQERELRGPFDSLDDFIDRVTISIEQLSILVRINAFRFTGIDKYELLWQAHFKLGHMRKFEDQYSLFKTKHRNFTLPSLHTTAVEAAFDQLELLGFCLCSPFELLREEVQNSRGERDLKRLVNHHIDIYGFLVTVKRTRTHNGKEMNFATFIDQHGEAFDAVLFPQVAAEYQFRGKGIYRLYGRVVDEFGFLSVEVIKMRKEDYREDPRYSD